MKCDKAEANLVAYIDGELPSRALPEFERHIKGCPVCRQSLEELRELIECRIPRQVPAPSCDLFPHIERRIAAPARAQITTLRRLSIAAAAAVALIAAGWLYRVNFLRGPGAEARTVAAALAQVKELTGWEGVRAVAAELAISEVEAINPAQASFIPLPSPGGEPVRIKYESAPGEFLQSILNPENYEGTRDAVYAGVECLVLHDAGKELWISRKTGTPVKVNFRTTVGGRVSIQDISYRRQEDVLVPEKFTIVFSGPTGEQSLRLTIIPKEVKLLRQEG
jgi:hypothetical protein